MKKTNSNEEAIELIIEEFEGNLSTKGKTELQKWINSNVENENTYREFQNLKNSMDILAIYKELDPAISWNSLEKKLEPVSDSDQFSAITRNQRKYKIWWFSAAAILICLISFTLYLSFNSNSITLNTLADQHIQYKLPDGSFITMNENTTIRYNENEFARNRKLTLLRGEAYFEVVHDPAKVFHIEMGDLRVTDIGTSFVVKRSDSEITVIVNTGKVAFEHLSSGNHVILDPGKKGIFLTGAKSIMDEPNPDINYKSWIDKKLSFSKAPLSEVVRELTKTYGSKVILKDEALKERMLSARLNYQTIDSALLVISASLQLKVHKEADHYVLDYK